MGKLEDLARLKFTDQPLSAAEEKVVQHASDGTIADCIDLGGGDDPEKSDTWPASRNVRADLIRWLLVDREARELVDLRGVWIQGARITGDLDLNSANVLFPLFLLGCRLGQSFNLRWAKMPVLSLEGSWTGPIFADGLNVEGGLFLGEGFHAEGEVRLLDATIGGSLNATGGTFKNSNGNALYADRLKVAGGVFLSNGFSAEGEVRLLGATIGGDLNATGGTFKNLKSDKDPHPTGDALSADGIKVIGSVFMMQELNAEGVVKNKFVAEGAVRLPGATIGGNLEADGGTFKNSNGVALNAGGIKVTGDLFLRNGFHAEGEARLLGATVGGNLEATGGTFKNSSGDALRADSIKVAGDVFLRNKFVAEGKVRLLGAEINGQLEIDDARLGALDLDSARVTGPFFWQNIHKDSDPLFPNKEWKPYLDLTNAKVGSLVDEAASWPEKGGLRLDGFVYDRIGGNAPIDSTARLRWLRLQPDELGYLPQPYEQLIAVLRQMGHERQVAKVAIAKQTDLRKRGDLGWWGWIQNWFLYLVVGYWYRPWPAFGWIALLVLLGTCVFSRAHSANVLVPSDQGAYTKYENSNMEKLPPYYPDFHAPLFSLDVVLPFDLGQKSNWRLIERWPGDRAYRLFELYSLIQQFVGGLLLLVAAAIWTGFIKKD